jgi:hypothetical protein
MLERPVPHFLKPGFEPSLKSGKPIAVPVARVMVVSFQPELRLTVDTE